MFKYNLDFRNSKTLQESMDHLAHKIAINRLLEINGAKCRIVDFEFYLNSTTKIAKDPHTYNNYLQKTSGRLYDHASGLDITFGDVNNAVGVLICGIAKLSTTDKNASSKYFIEDYFDLLHKHKVQFYDKSKTVTPFKLTSPNIVKAKQTTTTDVEYESPKQENEKGFIAIEGGVDTRKDISTAGNMCLAQWRVKAKI